MDISPQLKYQALRQQLEALMAQPARDLVAIDRLVNELEQTQLAVKTGFGIKGNNPNE